MTENHPDERSYNKIWDVIINKEIENYQKRYMNRVDISTNAKQLIWEKYKYFNEYCKVNYMKSPTGKIDRHKVCACYMMAILHASPIIERNSTDLTDDGINVSYNERLAITVAFSLLRAFTISAIKHKSSIAEDEKRELETKLNDGIWIPDDYINHGDFFSNYSNELYFAMMNGNLNILSLAHELFLLEILTLTRI